MSEINTEFAALKGDIDKSLKTLEADGSGVKTAIKKLEDQFQFMNKRLDEQRLIEKKHPLFGDHQQAEKFIDVLRSAVDKSNLPSRIQNFEKSSMYIDKSSLNTYGTGTGVELVPTATSSVLSLLLAQGGIARKYAKVLPGVNEKVVLPVRGTTSTAVFTANAGVIKDDNGGNNITVTTLQTNKVTLSPSQIGILSQCSEKLLYMSAINIAEYIATDMIEQAGVLEDNCVIKGDGTATYNGITGLNTLGTVPVTTVVAASWTSLDELIGLPAKVQESIYGSQNARYFMSGAMFSKARSFKNSSYYYLDPTTGEHTLAGYPVTFWHRLDNTAVAGKVVAYFGDLSKAAVIGIGRDMQIVVDHSFAFGSAQASFRMLYDFDCQFVQPTAMARLTLS